MAGKAKPKVGQTVLSPPRSAVVDDWERLTAPEDNRMGRPPIIINLKVVGAAAGMGCTIPEIAALCGLSERGFEGRMDADPSIREAMETGRGTGRVTLRRHQWAAAANGNPAMLIWLGKQLLGQRDVQEITGAKGAPLVMFIVPDNGTGPKVIDITPTPPVPEGSGE